MNRRTKIICTLGPATQTLNAIRSLIEAGMDVARLNFSHGTLEDHEKRIRTVRKAAAAADRPIAILADLPGPKIRIGVVGAESARLARRAPFTLTLRDVPGDASEVHLPNPPVFQAVVPGASLFLDDGLIELKVIDVTPTDIRTEVVNGGRLSSHKGLTLPGTTLDMPSLTDNDMRAIRFIAGQEIDWVAASFIRGPDDVRAVRRALESEGASSPHIIAKIEKHEAVDRLDEVLQAADGMMVARGDLGVERPIYEVPILQKRIISLCNGVGKPVITATQMLDSMIRNPRPTRAEVTDVANAVLDGADCVMLSGETAVGSFPAETVRLMRQVLLQSESILNSRPLGWTLIKRSVDSVTDSISEATVEMAQELNAAAILTATSSGYTARMVSRYRPSTPIIASTPDPATYRRLALTWGVYPLLTAPSRNTDETLAFSVQAVIDRGIVREGDLVVITAGVPTGVSGNTNLIKVHRIGAPMMG